MFASTTKSVSTTYFECTIRKVAYMGLCVKLRPSPPMWKFSFRFAREHSFPLYLKKINCFEEMLYRKIDFTFWGVTPFKRALKCITLNKMKKILVHYGDNALVFASTKKSVSTTYFECTIRTPICDFPNGKFKIRSWNRLFCAGKHQGIISIMY